MKTIIQSEDGNPINSGNPFRVIENDSYLQKSLSKKYFIGQTTDLAVSGSNNAWVELNNPSDSGVNVHVAVWAVGNVSGNNFSMFTYFGATFPGALTSSTTVLCVNRIPPIPTSQAEVKFVGGTSSVPSGGVQAFLRRIPSQTTIADDENGKFIIPPGQRFAMFLTNGSGNVTARGSFGWYEELV